VRGEAEVRGQDRQWPVRILQQCRDCRTPAQPRPVGDRRSGPGPSEPSDELEGRPAYLVGQIEEPKRRRQVVREPGPDSSIRGVRTPRWYGSDLAVRKGASPSTGDVLGTTSVSGRPVDGDVAPDGTVWIPDLNGGLIQLGG